MSIWVYQYQKSVTYEFWYDYVKPKKWRKEEKKILCYENYVMKNYDMFSLYTEKQIMFQKQKGTKKYYKNDYKNFSKIIKMFRSNST